MDQSGLSAAEVAERVRQGQVNRPRRAAWEDYAVIASRHLFTVFNFVVVPTAVMLFYYGDWRSGISVTGTALANTLIGMIQEFRAKRQLEKIAILSARKARVLRDGKLIAIPIDDVVLGDLIFLQAGETVVADGNLIDATYLEIDEALLTGESDPVRRHPGDQVLSGSICVTGEGRYQANKVGDLAFANSVTNDARRYKYTNSPITRIANQLITALSAAALGLCLIYGLLRLFTIINSEHMFQMIAATIVSMVPQGLVLTATVAFTIGAVVIGRRGALVQRLNAIEAMAAIQVICTDKTGTLTNNRLTLAAIHSLDSNLSDAELRHRIALFAWATIDRDNKNVQALRAAGPELTVVALDQLPFNARTRFSAVKVPDGLITRLLILGAPETLVPFLGPWEGQLNQYRDAGLRVLLFVEADSGLSLDSGRLLDNPQPIALLALADELRADAAAVLQALSAQGIAFKVLSGDNPRTVHATIRPLHLAMSGEDVVTGQQFAEASDPVAFVRSHSVYGRVEPLQKLAIVEALQQSGQNVAMIGDGVNDVLPIKKADLGIAMGEGSPAAKTVSSLVLETNNFAILPEAIEEGRTIVRNLRRAGKLFLTKNVYSLVFILAYSIGLFELPFPYLPQQVSLLNWMVIGIPALLIALTQERSGQPDRTPFLADVGGFALVTGLTSAVTGVTLLYLCKHHWMYDEATQRTFLLTMLIALGMTALWRSIRHDGQNLLMDKWLLGLSLLIMPIYAVFMYWPLTADFFRLTPFGGGEWCKVSVVIISAYLITLLVDRVFRVKPSSREV